VQIAWNPLDTQYLATSSSLVRVRVRRRRDCTMGVQALLWCLVALRAQHVLRLPACACLPAPVPVPGASRRHRSLGALPLAPSISFPLSLFSLAGWLAGSDRRPRRVVFFLFRCFGRVGCDARVGERLGHAPRAAAAAKLCPCGGR
jgi:hypothetical protein